MAAKPVCPSCGHEFFEMSRIEPDGSKERYEVMAVHCTKCGAVMGVIDLYNVGDMVQKIEEKLEDMEHRLEYLVK